MELLLKNKLKLICFLACVFLFYYCSNTAKENKETASETKVCKNDSAPINPNGDSELSLLMRKMLANAKTLKESTIKEEIPTSVFPEEFLSIHTAKPTDSETKKESFDGFAKNYINSLRKMYSGSKTELKNNFNTVVMACVSCHNDHCPGPLSAIYKLEIK